jgi:hypothetical protein
VPALITRIKTPTAIIASPFGLRRVWEASGDSETGGIVIRLVVPMQIQVIEIAIL